MDPRLTSVPFDVVCGLVVEEAAPARAAEYKYPIWKRRGVLAAAYRGVDRAAAGELPAKRMSSAPAWLTAAARQELVHLSTTWTQQSAFVPLRLLERLRLITLEHDDTYWLAVVGGLGDRRGQDSRPQVLAADPELLAGLHRIFEVEGGGEISLNNVDKFSAASWQADILQLVADGLLDRDDVLAWSLAALQRDWSAYRVAWYVALHAALAPTPAELAGQQEELRALLSSTVTATVSLAARRLKELALVGLLDPDPRGLEPGLTARTKNAALDIVKVLGALPPSPEVAEVAQVGLEHPAMDVQRAVRKLLATLGADVAEVVPAADLGVAPIGPPEARPVVPVTAADLAERTAALLEGGADGIEVELVLAGLVACADPGLLKPLLKRAKTVLGRDETWEGPLRAHIARLVLLAAGQHPKPVKTPDGRAAALAARLQDAEAVLTGGSPPRTLLATPTTTDGRLDLGVLTARRKAGRFSAADLAAARLRVQRPPSPDVAVVLASTVFSWNDKGTIRHQVSWRYTLEPASTAQAQGDWVDWLLVSHPLDAEPAMVELVEWVLSASADDHLVHEAARVLTSLARYAGPVGRLAAAGAFAGLASWAAPQRVLAVDAVLALGDRLTPSQAAGSLVVIEPALTLPRLAGSLQQVAAARGDAWVADVLTLLLPTIDPGRKGLNVMVELLEALEVRPVGGLRDWLATAPLTARSAAAAKRLLAQR